MHSGNFDNENLRMKRIAPIWKLRIRFGNERFLPINFHQPRVWVPNVAKTTDFPI